MRKLREGSVKICKVIIPRNIGLDKIALEQPGRRLQRSQSVQNLSPVSTTIRPQLDLPKIRSILVNPIGKPRRISFGRRKSISGRIQFDLPPQSPENNENTNMLPNVDLSTDAQQSDDAPLIDLLSDEDAGSGNVSSNMNTIFNVNELLQPLTTSQPDKQTTQTEENQTVVDEFDPLKTTCDANDSETDWSTFFETFTQNNVCSYRPVPQLLPINSVVGNKSPSPATRRPVPQLLPINSVVGNKPPFSAARRPVPQLLPINSVKQKESPLLATNRAVPQLLRINAIVDDQITTELDTSDEHFGKLHYDADSD